MKDFSIKVTVDLSPSTAALLSRLADGLENLVTGGPAIVANTCCDDAEPAPENYTNGAEHPADAPTTHLEPTEPQPEPDPQPEAEAPKAKPIDFESFRGRVAKYLAGGGDKAALKEYLTEKFGSGQVSAVPEDKRAEVLEYLGV